MPPTTTTNNKETKPLLAKANPPSSASSSPASNYGSSRQHHTHTHTHTHPPSSPTALLSSLLTKTTTTVRLRIANLCCEMEVKLVKDLLTPLPGVQDVKVSSVGRIAVVRYQSPATTTQLLDTLNYAHLGATIQDINTGHLPEHDHDKGHHHTHTHTAGFFPSRQAISTCLALIQRDAGPWAALAAGSIGFLLAQLGVAYNWRPLIKWSTVLPFSFLAFIPLILPLLRALKLRRVDVRVLMTIAVIGALILGDLREALAVQVMVLLADRVRVASLDYIARLLDSTTGRLVPPQARILVAPPSTSTHTHTQKTTTNKSTATLTRIQEVPLSQVQVGDLVLVRAGEQAPVDGVVVRGEGVMDESTLTGECMPVEKKEGSPIYGGSICQAGALEITCTHTAEHSSLALVENLVYEIAGTQTHTQELLDRFAAIYTPCVLVCAFLVALLSEIWSGLRIKDQGISSIEWASGLYRGLELLVLACPCALAMATPLPFLTALAMSASRGGVLFKSATAMEMLSKVEVLACDKTGTLTEGRFQVTGRLHLEAKSQIEPELTRMLAASVEARVAHRLSAAIVNDALGCVSEVYYDNLQEENGHVNGGSNGGSNNKNNNTNTHSHHGGKKRQLATVTKLKNLEGIGVEGVCTFDYDKKTSYKVVVGNEFLLEDDDKDNPALRAFRAQYPGEAQLFVLVDGVPEMALTLTDRLRPEATVMLTQIQALGIETALLTGDAPHVAEALQARLLLLSEGAAELTVTARMKPRDKLRWIQERQSYPPPSAALHSMLRRNSVFTFLQSPFHKAGEEDENRPETLEELEAAAEAAGATKKVNASVLAHFDHSSGLDGLEANTPSYVVPGKKQCVCAFVGDGVNDGPALMAADVGVAMGEHGVALAVSAADIVLLNDDLSRLPQAIQMSQAVRWVVIENLFLAVGLKFAFVFLLFSGRDVELWEAVASDSMSLMAVILNGLRTLYLAKRVYA